MILAALLAVPLVLSTRVGSPDHWYVYLTDWASVRPVAFYGRVVDPDGVPVEGVGVKMRLHGVNWTYILGGTGLTSEDRLCFRTDANGEFSLKGRYGVVLYLEDLEKEGYWFDQADITKRPVGYWFSRVRPEELYVPDPENPAVIVLLTDTEENLSRLDRHQRRRYEQREQQE